MTGQPRQTWQNRPEGQAGQEGDMRGKVGTISAIVVVAAIGWTGCGSSGAPSGSPSAGAPGASAPATAAPSTEAATTVPSGISKAEFIAQLDAVCTAVAPRQKASADRVNALAANPGPSPL